MSGNLHKLLAAFPKRRAPLTSPYQLIFHDEYVGNREGRRLASRIAICLEGWMHRQAARLPAGFPLLEVGAGTLNHVAFEPASGRYDAVEPWSALYSEMPHRSRFDLIVPSIFDIPSSRRYKRIISVAVLEHVLDLPELLARCGRLLDESGVLRFGIPSEGAPVWHLAWRFGTGISFRRHTGLDYEPVMRHEHVNNAREILALTNELFADVAVRYFPLPAFMGSLYTFAEARRPDYTQIALVEDYFGRQATGFRGK